MAAKTPRYLIPLAGGAAGCAICRAALGLPAAVLGIILIIAVMWTVSSPDRTRHLASLIRALRGSQFDPESVADRSWTPDASRLIRHQMGGRGTPADTRPRRGLTHSGAGDPEGGGPVVR